MIRWCLLISALVLLVEPRKSIKTLVYGGIRIRYDQHKYLIYILAMDTKNICSGSILNSMTILTAAHCFNRVSPMFAIKHHFDSKFYKIADVTQHGVIIHPEYNSKLAHRHVDLAIMKTEENIEFNENVQPIALALYYGVQISDKAIVAGFGRADPTGKPSGREGNVTITKCPNKHQNVICTLGYVRAASGDSGGALVYRNRLVGVTSGSCLYAQQLILEEPCLTVYANVTANIDWIKSQLDVLITTEIQTTTTDYPLCRENSSYSPMPMATSIPKLSIHRSGEANVYTIPIYEDSEE